MQHQQLPTNAAHRLSFGYTYDVDISMVDLAHGDVLHLSSNHLRNERNVNNVHYKVRCNVPGAHIQSASYRFRE